MDGVQPSRVILFGSRARGDSRPDSDYDLVVELAFERTEYDETYGRVSTALSGAKNGAATDLLIRAPGEIERKRDDPGYMDWEIARDGIILYPFVIRNRPLCRTKPRPARPSRRRNGSSTRPGY